VKPRAAAGTAGITNLHLIRVCSAVSAGDGVVTVAQAQAFVSDRYDDLVAIASDDDDGRCRQARNVLDRFEAKGKPKPRPVPDED
jgi:hypothetical protein